MEADSKIKQLSDEFKVCQKVLTALGDEVRQHLILVMMLSGKCKGLRDRLKRADLSS